MEESKTCTDAGQAGHIIHHISCGIITWHLNLSLKNMPSPILSEEFLFLHLWWIWWIITCNLNLSIYFFGHHLLLTCPVSLSCDVRARSQEDVRSERGERPGTITSIAREWARAGAGPSRGMVRVTGAEGGGDCQLLPAPARHPHTGAQPAPPRERRLSWDTGVISPPMLRLRLIIQEGASVIIMSSDGITCSEGRGSHYNIWDHGTHKYCVFHDEVVSH